MIAEHKGNERMRIGLRLYVWLLGWLLMLVLAPVGRAEEAPQAPLDMKTLLNEHVLDAHMWHFWDGPYGVLYLPVILYSKDRGWEVFSSHHFFDHHKAVAYKGYAYAQGKIRALDAARPTIWDFSITKNVAFLGILSLLLVGIWLPVGKRYRLNPLSAPRGIQALLEPVVLFVRDDIVRPCIGARADRYLPYMLTLFFFILFGNLMGLLPGAANLTGNIAVTLTLAVLTFVLTAFSGRRPYWAHVFWPPGISPLIKPLIVIVEFIGLFTKPIALTIRLFVAITAGHIVILSLLALAFLFQSIVVGLLGTVVVVFINLIELLVSAIQAYVFTMFSSLYIGLALEESH